MEKANSGDMANRCRTGSPEPEETVVDWVMLDHAGRTSYFDDPDDVDEALNNGNTAVAVRTASGHSGYFSFTLAAPPQVSYVDLHWPNVPAGRSNLLAYSCVLAADKDLLLLPISIPRHSSFSDVPADLFVYKAAGPSPSALRLPMHAMIDEGLTRRKRYLVNNHAIGILRLAGHRGRYIVSDLIVSSRRTDTDANLCVFSSKENGGSSRSPSKRANEIKSEERFNFDNNPEESMT